MESTIAAISTAYGEGGIGIVRISGEKSKEILNKIFKSSCIIENRKMTYGNIIDPATDEIVDEVLAVFMKGPNTYTREDIVEINCHGSIISLRNTLNLAIKMGARLAEEGEFTKRAFLNGRLDLSQAEAVIDIIKAKTDRSFDVAIEQLDGSISKNVKEMRNILMEILVNITVNIDYPDEDIEEIVYFELEKKLLEIDKKIVKLLDTEKTGKIIKEGLKVSIIGKPNVGKSSLMNSILKENRAIVTDIPGTTRDTIEERVNIKNIQLILTDTAGIRDTEDKIEKIGIEKSKKSFNDADLILLILDVSRNIENEDLEIISYIGDRKTIILANKIDLNRKIQNEDIKNIIPDSLIIETSMENGVGIDTLEDEIEKLVFGGEVKQKESLIINNVRHAELLRESHKSIEDAIKMVKDGEALDFIEVDVKSAYDSLGNIIGETVSDDIIKEVFARFCLGK